VHWTLVGCNSLDQLDAVLGENGLALKSHVRSDGIDALGALGPAAVGSSSVRIDDDGSASDSDAEGSDTLLPPPVPMFDPSDERGLVPVAWLAV